MCFSQRGDISTLNDSPLKLVNKFTNLGSSVSSSKNDINTRLAKAWTAHHRLSVKWKSDQSNKIKRAAVSILLYRCTTWMLTKRIDRKLDGNCTRMLWAILNKWSRQHPTKRQLCGYLPPISKTIQIIRTIHVEHCWRSKGRLISDVLLWTYLHGRARVGAPARTHL